MSGALSKFLGQPKEIEIEGTKLVIHPLKVKDMKLFDKTNPTPEEAQAISVKLLKLSIPESTEEEIENLSVDSFLKIMDEINKLNGFKDERLESIKAKIAQAGTK